MEPALGFEPRNLLITNQKHYHCAKLASKIGHRASQDLNLDMEPKDSHSTY